MKIIVSIILTFIVCSACVREPIFEVDSYGKSGSIPINLTSNSTDPEVAINKMRILVFDTGTGQLISNTVFTEVDPASKYKVTIKSGKNDFYVIANETEGMANALKSIRSSIDLESVLVDITPGTLPLPLYGSLKNVGIQVPEGSSEAIATPQGGAPTTLLPISTQRLMAKLNLTFIKNIPVGDADFVINDIVVSIKRTPKYSFLLEDTPYTETTQWADPIRVVPPSGASLSNNGKYIKRGDLYEIPPGVDHVEMKDIYIPEHILQDRENREFATSLVINAKFTNKSTSQSYQTLYQLDLAHALLNYNIYRNNQYSIYATIVGMGAIGLHAVIVPMKIKEISVGWTPYSGLVIVSDLIADYGKNKNVWDIYEQYSGILKMGTNNNYRDVLFKYGSVVGISNDDASAAFNPGKSVVWRPSSFTSTISKWDDVPYMPSGIIAPNTPGNVQKGIGDPCRLVSLSDKQIAAGIVDNKSWRMATPAEYHKLIEHKDLYSFDNKGFYSLRYLLIPGAKTRNEEGTIYSPANTGEYWSSQERWIMRFDVSSTNQAEVLQELPQKAFSIYCVRTTGIPESLFSVTGGTVSCYGGTSSIVVRQAHVPLYRVSLILGDPTAVTLPDPSEGHFDSPFPIQFTPLPNSYQPRSFTFKVVGYGVDGVVHEKTVVINQLTLSHSVEVHSITPRPPLLNGMYRISVEGGTFSFAGDISPLPVASIYNQMQWQVTARPSNYSSEEPDVRGTIATPTNKVTTITIPPNTSGNVRIVKILVSEISGVVDGVRSYKCEFIQPGR